MVSAAAPVDETDRSCTLISRDRLSWQLAAVVHTDSPRSFVLWRQPGVLGCLLMLGTGFLWSVSSSCQAGAPSTCPYGLAFLCCSFENGKGDYVQ